MTKIEKALYVLLSLIVVTYVCVRAYYNPLINDEAYTFLYFVRPGKFIPFDTLFWSANNHPVNSLLTWACYKLIGMEEWMLRLPNILAFVIFVFYSFKFGELFRSKIIRWSFWICLLATPYLLELFGYSRGYGLSIAFFTAAIWHFITAVQNQNLLTDWRSWLLMSLAVLSNLNLINSYFIWVLLFAFYTFDRAPWPKWLVHTLIRSAVLILPISMGLKLKDHNELYYGFQSNILDSLHSLVEALYGTTPKPWGYLTILLFLVIITIGLLLSKPLSYKYRSPLFIIASLIILNISASLVQHWLFGLNFPRERTTIHWYFLMLASVFYTLDHVQSRHWQHTYLISLLLLLIPIGQLSRYNLHKASLGEWSIQQFSDDFYQKALSAQKQNNVKLTLEGNILFDKLVFNYLNLKSNTPLSPLQYNSKLSHSVADILVVNPRANDILSSAYDTLSINPNNGAILIKRTQTPLKEKFYINQLSGLRPDENGRYPLAHIKVDSLVRHTALFSVELGIQASCLPNLLHAIIDMKNAGGETIASENIELTPLKSDWSDSQNINFTFTWYDIPPLATLAEVYIWNQRNLQLDISHSKCAVFDIKEHAINPARNSQLK